MNRSDTSRVWSFLIVTVLLVMADRSTPVASSVTRTETPAIMAAELSQTAPEMRPKFWA